MFSQLITGELEEVFVLTIRKFYDPCTVINMVQFWLNSQSILQRKYENKELLKWRNPDALLLHRMHGHATSRYASRAGVVSEMRRGHVCVLSSFYWRDRSQNVLRDSGKINSSIWD